MKYLIFDAGPIISLTTSGMLPVIEELKKVFDGEFILTPSVKHEIIDRPMKIKKFELEAIKVKDMLDRGIFKMSSDIIPNQKIDKESKRLLKIINSVLRTAQTGEKIKIVHAGEVACLAFSTLCEAENVIVIDERTTRMLTEAPNRLEEMMERKLHIPIKADISLLNKLKKFKFIRSSELLFVAYEKKLIQIEGGRDLLDALLYSVKFKGTAISSKEIEEMKKLAKQKL